MKIKDFSKILFSAVSSIIIFPGFLKGEYILTLDNTFGPNLAKGFISNINLNVTASYLLNEVLHYGELITNGWIIEKILFLILFFLLFYLPLRFYPFISHHGERYAAAILFAVNPFVYERFLAGQWAVLFGYALLFPLVSLLIKLICGSASWRTWSGIFIFLWLIGCFTLHYEVMGVIAIAIGTIIAGIRLLVTKDYQTLRSGALKGLVALVLFLIASSYWLIPVFTAKSTVLDTFNSANWEAFSTAGTGEFGTVGNVVTLYGFWEENNPWIKGFYLPDRTSASEILVLVLFVIAIGAGKWKLITQEKRHWEYAFILILAILAIIFSAGVGQGIFHGFNEWIFNHIEFWRGFRDTEKWSGQLVLVYSLLFGAGVGWMLQGVERMPAKYLHQILRSATLLMFCLLPIAYMPAELFGFAGQLQPVSYPQSWAEANVILKKDSDCKALFLPWHEYYSLGFDNNRLVANTASTYFNCTIVSSQDTELGDIGANQAKGPGYVALDAAISSNTTPADTVIGLLKAQNIHYIIFSTSLIATDPYKYRFLNSPNLQEIFRTSSLVLYQVVW
jgi:hypothetical protein